MLLELEQVLSAVYQSFLELRLDAKLWDLDLKQIQGWVKAKWGYAGQAAWVL